MTGLWSPAAEQGRVAALTALGLAARYDHQVPVVTVKLAGLSVRSAGQLRAQGPGQLELCHRPTEATLTERYTKVVIEVDLDGNEHVLGAIVVGDDPDGDDMLAAAATRAHSGTLGAALMQRPWQRQRSELLDPPQPGHAAGQTVIVRDIPARTSQRKATVARKVA
jgi:NAD(P)H-nitrite reductase large subunit